MDAKLKQLLNSELFDTLVEIAKEDEIVKSVIKNSDDLEKFVNSMIAALICIIDKNQKEQEQLALLMRLNPQISKMIELRNDPSLLSNQTTRQQ